jgi:hypothetical protein
MLRRVKEWFPAIASVLAVLLTASYAVTRQSRAAEEIADIRRLANSLASDVDLAARTTPSPAEMDSLEEHRHDLEARMRDSCKPGLVVSALTETAREAGLIVREIQPMHVSGGRPGSPGEAYPKYIITVQGEYRRIAEYMDLCACQRLPARPCAFRITQPEEGRRYADGTLVAAMTVEAFQPLSGSEEETGDN